MIYHINKKGGIIMNLQEYLRKAKDAPINILHISHTDLDGAMPAYLLNKFITDEDINATVRTVFIEAGKDIDDFISSYIDEGHKVSTRDDNYYIKLDLNEIYSQYEYYDPEYDSYFQNVEGDIYYGSFNCIVITDLFPSAESIHKLNELVQSWYIDKFFIFDHHISQQSEYDSIMSSDPDERDFRKDEIMLLQFHPNGMKTCGTSILYEELFDPYAYIRGAEFYYGTDVEDDNVLLSFVERVRQWDTWDWKKTITPFKKYPEAQRLNWTFQKLGRNDFFDHIAVAPSFEDAIYFNDTINTLASYTIRSIESDIKRCVKHSKEIFISFDKVNSDNIRVMPFPSKDFYRALIMPFPKEASCGDVSDAIHQMDKYEDTISLCIFVDIDTVSFRSYDEEINGLPPFDCATFAKQLGGGGHKQAAGAPIWKTRISFKHDIIFDI